jgi:hypothetical protein
MTFAQEASCKEANSTLEWRYWLALAQAAE